MSTPPTPEEIRSAYICDTQDIVKVTEVSDSNARNVFNMTTTFKRLSDNTCWAVSWISSRDGEFNEIRDGGILRQDIK